MTTRERFNRVFRREKPDRVPDMEFGYWDKTIAVENYLYCLEKKKAIL